MITARKLVKRYGDKTAVAGLDFSVQSGVVTGFLGPNGSGKSTTLRMILGLDAPTSGTVTVRGRRYADNRAPLCEVGALLEARSAHPGRTALSHLLCLARTHGIPRRRADEVLGMAGLEGVAHKRTGGFSLGMSQRMGIAAALLGDPDTVILDEPVNGLDPEGVLWIRNLMQQLASEGRTVFVSSHLMSEMALTARNLIIIGQGELLADTTVEEFVSSCGADRVTVTSPEASLLRGMITGPGIQVKHTDATGTLEVTGLSAEHIGRTAAACGIPLFALTEHTSSLEEAFMELTGDRVEYQGAGA